MTFAQKWPNTMQPTNTPHPLGGLPEQARDALRHEVLAAFTLARTIVRSPTISRPARFLGLWMAFLQEANDGAAEVGEPDIPALGAVKIAVEGIDALGEFAGIRPALVAQIIEAGVPATCDALDDAVSLVDLGDGFPDPREDRDPSHTLLNQQD